MTRDLTDIPMSVFSRVSTSRNKSSFVGGYLRHGERFAAWFTGQSWWMRSRTMSGDRTEERKKERERERERENKSEGGRKIERERPGKNREERQSEERKGKKERKREKRREGTFFLVAATKEESEGPPCTQGREGSEENVVLCSSRCRSSSPGSFLRRGQRPTKPRSRLRCRFNRV